MDKAGLVSVIVPAYNAGKFIDETINSVIGQTYTNWELIVCDDGSTDNTVEIVEELAGKDPRIKYVYQKNAGQSAARNTAIANAKGEYIAFLDSDDLFLPTKLERQVAYLQAHPECGLSYCKIFHFYDTDKESTFYFSLPHPSGLLFRDLLKSNFINPLSVVVRRNVLERWGAFEGTYRRLDEQYLWLKLSWHGVRFDYLDEPLALYRIHRSSLSNEARYFLETEEQFLKLLPTIREWVDGQDKEYGLDTLERRIKFRRIIGEMMAANNPLSKLLLKAYYWRRNRRLNNIQRNG